MTLAELLTRAGYATALLGEWHLGYEPGVGPLRQGFGTFRGFLAGGLDYHSHVTRAGAMDWWHDEIRTAETGYTTDLLTDHAIRFIEQHRERPFLALVSYQAVHYPYQTREDEPYRVVGKTYWQNPREGGASDPRAAYPKMLRALDDGVGRLVAALARLGLERRTLVLLTSDNGGDAEVANHGGFRGFKESLAEGGHRVPAIASWPGRIAAGRTMTDLAVTMDLLPTVAALAGAVLPADLEIDGVDLGPALLEGRRLPPRTVFWRYGKSSAARRGRWKVLVTPKLRALLDLEKDPAERFNVWRAHPPLATELLRQLERWKSQWPALDSPGAS